MLRVGLTGGIAAGKSMVSRRLEELGAVLIDADVIAREVVEPGTPGFEAVVAEFGAGIVTDDGTLDRTELGRVVFGDHARREALNAIVHPLVGERRTALVNAAPAEAVVVEDVPLLVENGLGAGYHVVVVVHAPEDVRVRRLVTDRGMETVDAEARIRAQARDADRRAAADAWLDNTGRPDEVMALVDALWTTRLVPFEENVRVGRPARSDPSTRPAPVPYDPDWPVQAARLIGRLQGALGEWAHHIEHVGPTAQPGTAAPDVLDLDVAMANKPNGATLAHTLAKAGFVPGPADLGNETEAWFVEADPARPAEVRLGCRS